MHADADFRRLSRLPSLSKRRRVRSAWAVQATTSGGSDPTRTIRTARSLEVWLLTFPEQASTRPPDSLIVAYPAGTTFSEVMPEAARTGFRPGPVQSGGHAERPPLEVLSGTMHALYQESLIRHFEETLDLYVS